MWLAINSLGSLKPNWSGQYFMISVLVVYRNFIQNLFTAKSKDLMSPLDILQASVQYNNTAMHTRTPWQLTNDYCAVHRLYMTQKKQ